MRNQFGAALVAVLSFWGSLAGAQDVELRSLDGAVELEGNLISYDGAYYRLDTVYGPLTVSAEGVSCAGPGCPDLATFVAEARIAGAAPVVEGLLPALLSAFAESRGLGMILDGDAYVLQRPDGTAEARFVVTAGTTAEALQMLREGGVDIALTLREPSVAEIRAAAESAPEDPPLDDRVRVLGLDALVPVVSDDNPMATLSLQQIAALFSGDINNWQDIGGPDAPVALHLLDAELGLAQAFAARVLLPAEAGLADGITRHLTAEALATAIARDAYAVGITTRSGVGDLRALPLSGTCGFAQSATLNAVKAEDYPLTAPVYMYLAPRRLPLLVRQFLDFTEGDAAEREVREAGFVDQLLTRTPLADQGERLINAILAGGEDVTLADLQDLLQRLGTAERLSTTFRFNPGGAELDVQSRTSIQRLAAAIEAGDYDGRTLLFVGFSDGQGAAAVNERLSLRRADVVRDALLAALDAAAPERVILETAGYGELLPMACDDSEWGRAVNRRVEVWVQ